MNINNLIEATTILAKYFDDPNGYHLSAEHDQIYVYETDRPLTPGDVERLFELGWFQPDAENEDVYESDSGWSHFT